MGEVNVKDTHANFGRSAAFGGNLNYHGGGSNWTTLASFSITTNGNPVKVGLQAGTGVGGGGLEATVRLLNVGARGDWRITRDGVEVARGLCGEFSAFSDIYYSPSAFNFIDFDCPSGSHTYAFQGGAVSTTSTAIYNAIFYGIEL